MSKPLEKQERSPTQIQDDDAAKRIAEVHTLHQLGNSYGQWMAIRLIDGSSDGIPYPSFQDAARHQLHRDLCFYIQVQRDFMTTDIAGRLLRYWRQAYKAGFRQPDPEVTNLEPISPFRIEEL